MSGNQILMIVNGGVMWSYYCNFRSIQNVYPITWAILVKCGHSNIYCGQGNGGAIPPILNPYVRPLLDYHKFFGKLDCVCVSVKCKLQRRSSEIGEERYTDS